MPESSRTAIDRDSVLAGIAEIVYEVSGRAVDTVTPDATFIGDLELDSLTMVEVVVAAEQRFDVRIPDDDVVALVTVGDAVDYVLQAAGA